MIRVGIVVPHIFMHRDILPNVIFSPAELALQLAKGLGANGIDVTLYTPGPVDTPVGEVTADLTLFEAELALRGDSYLELLKKHPLTFISLARQVQSEIIAKAFAAANRDELDLVHIYTNEEDLALPFAALCNKPVVFTHHDPFNFLVKYRSLFPKYPHLPWVSLSEAQRKDMPKDTNWLATIYHGLDPALFSLVEKPSGNYVAYFGRIIEPKGVHLAIQAIKVYNRSHDTKLKLKIAGKHYAGTNKDTYWQQHVAPFIDTEEVEYCGFIRTADEKQAFLGNATALVVPSLFEEPFGMVMIEALACGTPVIGLNSGAIPEVISSGVTGVIVDKAIKPAAQGDVLDPEVTSQRIAEAIDKIPTIDRRTCREIFEKRFTVDRMCKDYAAVYKKLLTE